jgi:zinc/manganese transport system substrate-binding protein
VQLDPHNIQAVARALSAKLSQLDPGQAAFYAARARDFDARWDAAIKRWESRAAPLKGAPVVVMHRDQAYLCHWLGLVEVASIEPKPGVPPTAAYLGTLVGKLTTTPAKLILLNAYNDPKAANWLAERVHTPVVVLPYSVGGSPEAKNLFGLFDDTLNKLLAAGK